MRKLLLAAAALGGLTAMTATGAVAAPAVAGVAGVHVAPSHAAVSQVDYWYRHRHWHHRRYEHGHWHYWD